MISVLVLVQCNYSFLSQIKNHINKMEGLEFLYEVIDNYNLILKLSAETKEELQGKVGKISHIPNTANVLSLIVLQ
jgi:nitrate reductase NapAB chaperone NapD